MELVLIGFPGSGKSTLFRAVTETSGPPTAGARWGRAQVGVVKVPDPRLDALAKLFRPQRVVPAELRLVDLPPWGEGRPKGAGIIGELLATLQGADALVHVVQAFAGGSVPVPGRPPQGPERAVEEMDVELAFADLGILERRAQRLDEAVKGAKPSDRTRLLQEKELVERVKAALEQDIPVRKQTISEADRQTLRHFQLLTAKPVLIVLNVGEQSLGPEIQQPPEKLLKPQGHKAITVCAKLEEELLAMPPQDRAEFRSSLGLPENSRDAVVHAIYALLDMVTFFTAAHNELRAWPVERGTPAANAAGKVHSDMERGFIRAEVVTVGHLLECGSIAEARRRGQLRLEGKTYIVQEGDVITFLFNV